MYTRNQGESFSISSSTLFRDIRMITRECSGLFLYNNNLNVIVQGTILKKRQNKISISKIIGFITLLFK